MNARAAPLPPIVYEDLLRASLRDDLGRGGDLTSDTIVPDDLVVSARLVVRSPGRVAGLEVAIAAFRLFDSASAASLLCADGDDVVADTPLAELRGRARALLAPERTALNLLGHLSGIATQTRDVVRAVEPWGTRITGTRKTLPLLGALQKYAVRVGGGANHRFGLDDAVLIKDTHRAIAGGAVEAVRRARAGLGHMVKVEVEIEDLDELRAVMEEPVDVVLLDNMPPETLRQAVDIVARRAITEASGGITLQTAPAYAATGVDVLSLGWLTHTVTSLDVSLEILD